MTVQVFMKRLADVEIDPARSNQHEFNAGRLRRELGFEERTSGTIDFLIYTDDASAPEAATESYTLYDAREASPDRSEWRLYYTNLGITAYAQPNDLMLVFRPSREATDLRAIVVRRGTELERKLVQDLAGREPEELLESLFVESEGLDPGATRAVLDPLGNPALVLADLDLRDHPLYRRAVTDRRIPPTSEMIAAAQDAIESAGISVDEPDRYVDAALSTETQLFFSIESAVGNRELDQLRTTGRPDFPAVMEFAMSYLQSRRTRRGESLEKHFQRLLEGRGVPHTAQCTTEPGKLPDFIIPSCDSYHERTVPDERLRMVGCKTKVRERHAQWVTEAARVRLKFALCVDEKLTDNLISTYDGRLRFFLPRRLLESKYAARATRPLLGSVAELIADLEDVAGLGRA